MRDPHPDGAVEIRLQRIVSLQTAVARKEALAAQDQAEVAALRAHLARHPTWDGASDRAAQVEVLLDEIDSLDGEIVKLHDEIAARAGELSDTDLAYLNPRRRDSR